jgi:hypothetical protein
MNRTWTNWVLARLFLADLNSMLNILTVSRVSVVELHGSLTNPVPSRNKFCSFEQHADKSWPLHEYLLQI